jgi:hypothetical protein
MYAKKNDIDRHKSAVAKNNLLVSLVVCSNFRQGMQYCNLCCLFDRLRSVHQHLLDAGSQHKEVVRGREDDGVDAEPGVGAHDFGWYVNGQ